MTRPVILLDCDGVLADLVTPLVEEANKLPATSRRVRNELDPTFPDISEFAPITPDDVTDYDIAKAFPGLTPAQVYAPLYRQGFCRSLKPYPGAVEAVRRLQELGEVYCVTKPTKSPYWMAEREEWLQVVCGIPADHVIFCHDKGMVRGNILVDDNPEFLDAWVADGGDGEEEHAFLWSRSYNQEAHWLCRVASWEPIIECVERLT
jgi:5'(3')-deoxyribonucleotidase